MSVHQVVSSLITTQQIVNVSREIQIFANEIQIFVFFDTINYFQSSGFTPTRTFLYLQQFLWPLYLSTDFAVILFIYLESVHLHLLLIWKNYFSRSRSQSETVEIH